MTQSSPIEPFDGPAAAIADYRQQACEFLAKSRQYLADNDLHQASEKGWGTAWMAKAVSEAQGWQYRRHEEFADVLNRARVTSGDEKLRQLRAEANELHGYFYTRKRILDPEDIGIGLDQMEILLDILEPLTNISTT